MCGGGGGGDGGAAERERARQQRIAQGARRINQIFDGTTRGINPFNSVPEVGAQAFTRTGEPVRVAMGRVQNEVLPSPHGRQPKRTFRDALGFYNRQGKFSPLNNAQLFQEKETTGGFNDEFFDKRRQAFMDFSLPQFNDQLEKQKQGLIFNLARNGRLESKTRSEKFGDLDQQKDVQLANIQDDALQFKNQARRDVENARADLIQQNSALANPAQVANLASNRAQVLTQSPSFDPLGQLFTNASAGLATSVDADRKRRRLNELSNLNLFNNSRGSASIIGGR